MRFLRLLIMPIMALAAMAGFAASPLDSEGYPELYIKGTFTSWAPDDNYRMTRSGNTYSITIPLLDGEFKVSAYEWDINYGAVAGDNPEITVSTVKPASSNGPNFVAANLSDVSISFDINPADFHAPININFSVGGVEPGPSGMSGTLPVLYINVYTDENHTSFNNEIISRNLAHKNYFSYAEYWLDLNGCTWLEELGAASIGSAEEPLALEIKGRGNWTLRGFAKKPFKLKLKDKQKMLGLTKSKHFALLAHADDHYGYLRNYTGFNLGKRIGLPWTPAQQPVEVVINGDYRGLYFLTESIRIEKDRVNIEELDDLVDDPALISGGYLVELDNYDEDNQIQMDENSCLPGHPYLDKLRITPDTPEEYSELQRRFVTDQFTAMNNAVGDNSNDLWAYMDLDDAARYYIVEEIISHTESYHGSTYLFRDRGEGRKWHFSPLWDCGNAFSGPDDDFFYNHSPYGNTWIPSIRQNQMFNAKVRETWMWFMTNRYAGIEDDIREYAGHIAAAAIADRNRWAGEPAPDGGADVVDNSDMGRHRDRVLGRLAAKTQWLRGQFGDYTAAGNVPEPERDTTPAAPLPSYASSGVEDVAVPDADGLAPEYYTLEGIRIPYPASGTLVIERRGNVTRKLVVR